jgi:hypothetical protein
VRVLRHSDKQICPICHRRFFCDDCAFCEACLFCPPDVTAEDRESFDLPPAPAPLGPEHACRECGAYQVHARTCSITRKAVAS